MDAAVDCIEPNCFGREADAENFTEDGWVVGVVYTCRTCDTTWFEGFGTLTPS